MTAERDRLALAAIERAERAVDDLCAGRLRWEMRVPAEPDHDPDLIISEALRQAREAIAARAEDPRIVPGTGKTWAELQADAQRREAAL